MTAHALEEALALLRRRGAISAVLALSLVVPMSLAGFTISLGLWARPLVALERQTTVVRVLLHPRMDTVQRQDWLAEQVRLHPGWRLTEVRQEALKERLKLWFPYLEDLLEGENPVELPTLVEVEAEDHEEVSALTKGPAVIAVGPTSSVDQILGLIARRLGWLLGGISIVLLASASLLAATWIHLEVYRHADEITIMRLVGATEGAIRSPFLIAALIPGICAGVGASVGAWYLVHSVGSLVESMGLTPPAYPTWLPAAEIAVGMILPVAAAIVTMARHAKLEEAE
ncbi:MAG: hypothetical protein DRJ65_04575 [Acidobacteria bacterium]|nr:MAG: hypothetical protein DRJ65_04575 [Acidobacteriota bacterium]